MRGWIACRLQSQHDTTFSLSLCLRHCLLKIEMSDTEDHADASDCSNGQSPPKRPQRFRDRSKVKYQPIFFVSFFMPHELVFAFYDVGFIFFLSLRRRCCPNKLCTPSKCFPNRQWRLPNKLRNMKGSSTRCFCVFPFHFSFQNVFFYKSCFLGVEQINGFLVGRLTLCMVKYWITCFICWSFLHLCSGDASRGGPRFWGVLFPFRGE